MTRRRWESLGGNNKPHRYQTGRRHRQPVPFAGTWVRTPEGQCVGLLRLSRGHPVGLSPSLPAFLHDHCRMFEGDAS
jgi:hypothetical protein